MQVSEVMTNGVESVGPGCSLKEAAHRMKRHNVGILPVLKDARVVGVLTDRDIIVRAVAADACLERTKVREIMTPKPVFCHADDELKSAARLMEEKKVRRILVLNREEKAVGLLSLDDFGKRIAGQDVAGEILEAVGARRV